MTAGNDSEMTVGNYFDMTTGNIPNYAVMTDVSYQILSLVYGFQIMCYIIRYGTLF